MRSLKSNGMYFIAIAGFYVTSSFSKIKYYQFYWSLSYIKYKSL